MCKLGDIIVIKEFKNEIGKIIKQHSFVVINDEFGSIEGYDYDFICNMLCSFHNQEHKRRKLSFKENMEISANIISNNKINNKKGYIKADQLYYFNKNNIKYYVIAKLNMELQIKLLKLLFLLDNEEKIKIITTNLVTNNKEEANLYE